MRLLVDCANGAAYHIAPKVFHELGANVTVIGDKPNGLNINVGCGVSEPAAAVATLRECRADVGVVLDGDADRVMMIDEKGDQINGDALLLLSPMICKGVKNHRLAWWAPLCLTGL